MTTFLLIRHASTDATGNAITGRTPGVHLNERGREEAERLTAYLGPAEISAVYSSPRERCQETAQPIAQSFNLPVLTCEPLDELEYGSWSGCLLKELEPLQQWRRFNTFRSIAAAPHGELILELQTRIVKLLEMLRQKHPNGMLALVTHAEAIRAAQAHYLGIPIDLAHRLEISPASISTIRCDQTAISILGINQQPLYPARVAT